MSRTRRLNLGSLEDLRQDMDRLMERFLGNLSPSTLIGGKRHPPCAVWEDEQAVVVQMDLPGTPTEGIEVELQDRRLTLKGYRPPMPTGVTLHWAEVPTGEFARTIDLPVDVDPDKIDATLAGGILTVRLLKTVVSTARRVAVRAAPDPGPATSA